MATKWTPQVIAAEVARKKAASEDRNYGKVTPPPKPATPSYSTPTPMPSTAKGSLVTQPFNPNTPVSTWGGASPINGGVNTPPKTGAPVPYSAPKVSTPPMLNSATNTGGTPPTMPGYGMNVDGTPNLGGLKDLGYGYHSTGDMQTGKWNASTYDDSVRIIGKSSTDWNAKRASTLDYAFKTGDWTAYNAHTGSNIANGTSGSAGQASSVSTPPMTGGLGGGTTATTNYGSDDYGKALYYKKTYDEAVNSGNSGLKNWAATQAKALYASNPEMAKIAQGMNSTQLAGYLTNRNAPQQSTQPTPEVAQEPVNTPSTPPVDYNALAGAEQARYLADISRNAGLQKDSLTRTFQRGNEIERGNRSLEDFQLNSTLNPFSGKTSWDKGLVGRERTLADETSLGNYNAGLAGIDQGLNDAQNTAAQEIMKRAYQLEQDAKDFGLREADVTGRYKGQLTPQGESQMLSNEINRLKLQNLPQELKLGLQELEQRVKSGAIDIKAAEYELKEMTDPNSVTNRANKLDLQMKELEAKYLPEEQRLKLQELRKRISNIGKTKPTDPTTARMRQINLEKAEIELTNLKDGKPDKPPKYDETPEWAGEIAEVNSGDTSYDYILQNSTHYISQYGYDGYAKLLAAAKDK